VASQSNKSEISFRVQNHQHVDASSPSHSSNSKPNTVSGSSSSSSSSGGGGKKTGTSGVEGNEASGELREKAVPQYSKETQARLAKVDANQRMEDEQLDVLSGLLTGLQVQAKEMGNELDVQNQLISHIDARVDSSTDRIKVATKDVNRIT